VTRVLSGAALLVFAIAVVWFATPILFLAVAELLLLERSSSWRNSPPRAGSWYLASPPEPPLR